MMGGYEHNNPWAEKLQNISLPDVDETWKAMAVVLDREMPRRPGKDRRRWLLLIILLLLLLGICNCPGRWRTHPSSEAPSSGKERITKATEKERQGREVRTGTDLEGVRIAVVPVSMQQKTGEDKGQKEEAGLRHRQWKKNAGGQSPGPKKEKKGKRKGEEEKITDNDQFPAGDPSSLGAALLLKDTVNNKPETNKPGGKTPGKMDSLGKKKEASKKDTATAGKPKEKKAGRLHPERGWVVGVGLNQFFTLGQQQHSGYNSGGTTGGLGDYLPVPMIRFYFNRKLFIQLEAQLNAPQYTKKNLLVQQSSRIDTAGRVIPLVTENSVYIKKLFYFNLPLSVHYSPFRNFYIGTGLQFSRLTNGVGLFGDNVSQGATNTSSSSVKNLKNNDTVYHQLKTDEFRWLLDMSYTYKHFIFGLRYNQALSNFIDVRISTTQQVVQSRNSSLQLYLRYILWDSRKKKASPAE